MKLSYTNELEMPVTRQQVINLDNYQILYRPDDNPLIKKIEKFQNKIISVINYYLDAGETEATVVSQLSPLGCPFFVIQRETYLSYTIENRNGYEGGALSSKSRILFDSSPLEIAYEYIILSTTLPDPTLTEKYLGVYVDGSSINYCLFRYNADGSLFYCDYNYLSDQDRKTFESSTVSWIRNVFDLTDSMYNYYLTADFTPPSN